MKELFLYEIYKINKLSNKHKLILLNLGESVSWLIIQIYKILLIIYIFCNYFFIIMTNTTNKITITPKCFL